VAIAVLLMTVVTGVSLGLSSTSAVESDAVDYWIVPEETSAQSIAVSTSGPRLGATHGTTARLERDERVDFATPVLLQVASLQRAGGGPSEYVVLVGIVPPESDTEIMGLPTGPLTPGDPYYANGTYDGRWTGEAVLSESAAELLDTRTGETVRVGGDGRTRNFTVENVSAGEAGTAVGTLPVGLVHLSELQTVAKATEGDTADQILVSTDARGMRETLTGVYPGTTVVARGGLSTPTASVSSLPFAMAVAALLTALVVGVLFVGTIMGLEVTADKRHLATLGAMGYSDRALSVLVVTETVCLSLLGGTVGVLLGIGGIALTNALSNEWLGVTDVATFHPLMLGYGVGVAILIGLLATPYPVLLSRRLELQEVLS
jgi:putative ABC transport system permease protein